MNAAMHYLGRFESNQQRLQEVLERKVQRWTGVMDTSGSDAIIKDTIKRCASLDLVNDGRFAAMRAQLLMRRGKAVRHIVQDLRARGIAQTDIDQAVAAFGQHDAKDAIITLAKRRRLGLFRNERAQERSLADPRKWRDKELGALMRAGHSYHLSAAFLGLDDELALEEWLEDV